jgi:hypothetical protein
LPDTDRMSYWFRLRFHLSTRSRIGDDAEQSLTLQKRANVEVIMELAEQSKDYAPLGRRIVVIGRGYATYADADQAASEWRDSIIDSLTRLQVGADFGDRATQGGGMAPAFRAELEEKFRAQILSDIHGIAVFEVPEPEARPVFWGGSGHGARLVMTEEFLAGINSARTRNAELTDKQRLAYDLFSGSFFQPSPDARFMMLAMALETLIELNPRAINVRQHVDKMIADTEAASIDESEIRSIKGSLSWLRDESISQGGRRLARVLGERKYMNSRESPTKFFNEAYKMRSALVHGSYPRPNRSNVDMRAANLEVFVANLIAVLAESSQSSDDLTESQATEKQTTRRARTPLLVRAAIRKLWNLRRTP